MRDGRAQRIYRRDGFAKRDVLDGARALDVGCGNRKLPGATGMDILALPSVDVVHDFNRMPWPFSDASFDLVLANHALEHADDVIAFTNEAHRVLAPGGRIVVQVPYFRSTDAYTDPTHQHFFTSGSLDYILENSGRGAYAYTQRRYVLRGFWYGWPHTSSNPLVRLFKRLITLRPDLYDQYLSLLVPVDCLTWELEVVK